MTAVEQSVGNGSTAVIAFNDQMALGVLAGLTQRGIRVPDDMSIVGCDDVPMAAMVAPPLTTIRMPTDEAGAVAVGLLADSTAKVELFGSLVVRASTGPVVAQTETRSQEALATRSAEQRVGEEFGLPVPVAGGEGEDDPFGAERAQPATRSTTASASPVTRIDGIASAGMPYTPSGSASRLTISSRAGSAGSPSSATTMLPVIVGDGAAGIGGEPAKAIDGRRGHLRWNRHREPAVAVADGAPQRGVGRASHEDRRDGGAGGEFDDGRAVHVGERRRLAGDEVGQHGERGVGACARAPGAGRRWRPTIDRGDRRRRPRRAAPGHPTRAASTRPAWRSMRRAERDDHDAETELHPRRWRRPRPTGRSCCRRAARRCRRRAGRRPTPTRSRVSSAWRAAATTSPGSTVRRAHRRQEDADLRSQSIVVLLLLVSSFL